MKQTLTIYQIAQQLHADNNAAWSYQGARTLAEYLDENMPEDAEFDFVEVRCNWSEHSSLVEWANDYFGNHREWSIELGIPSDADSDDVEDKLKDYINDRGILIEMVTGGVIVSSF